MLSFRSRVERLLRYNENPFGVGNTDTRARDRNHHTKIKKWKRTNCCSEAHLSMKNRRRRSWRSSMRFWFVRTNRVKETIDVRFETHSLRKTFFAHGEDEDVKGIYEAPHRRCLASSRHLSFSRFVDLSTRTIPFVSFHVRSRAMSWIECTSYARDEGHPAQKKINVRNHEDETTRRCDFHRSYVVPSTHGNDAER